MNTTTKQHDHSLTISRRQALKLAISSVLIVTGCTSMSKSSDLDTAVSDLNGLLNETAVESERTLLTSIASKIESRARELVAEHKTFTGSFDHLISDYKTTEAQLNQAVAAYTIRRRQLRDELLHLQDELHYAMTPDEWDEVVQILNQTGDAISSYTLSGT